MLRVLAVGLCCLSGSVAKADIVQTLSNTPVSQFDLGMHRLEHYLERHEQHVVSRVQNKMGPSWQSVVQPHYDPKQRRVIIQFDFIIEDLDVELKSDACDRTLQEARRGANLTTGAHVAVFFHGYGGFAPSNEMQRQVVEILSLTASVVSYNKDGNGRRRYHFLQRCSQPIK